MKSKSTIWGIVLITIGVVILIAAALLWGFGVWGPGIGAFGGSADGITGTVDRHFLEQMIPHHEDAVAMAELALTRAEHPELKQLAETIIRDQTREIDQMRTWYESWYGTAAPVGGEVRSPGGGMMGGGMMNDGADLEVLAAAAAFDKEFIEQMIPHHQMGVMMARMVLARSDRTEIQELGRSIIETQTAEIEQMRDWYGEWYGR
jgi:uncharacterized protein (DUF305 family)